MGNISSLSTLEDDSEEEEDVQNRLIRVQQKPSIPMNAIIQYGADIENKQDLNKYMNTISLTMLHKYLTYNSALHTMDAKNDLLALIAFIISEYAEIKSSINTTLEFRAIIKSTDINTNLIRADVFENMLCAATWNGILYLVNPLNHNKLNSHIYTINNGYHSGNLQQRMLCEIQSSSKILFDPNLCCSVSHIVNRKQIPYKNTNIFYPNSSMIIDGLIFCNSELNIVYGYSIISGLYQIQKFKKTKSHNDIERYEVVINLWRQNIDAFILTSKFNLFGIKITHKTFHIQKICTFTEAVQDICDIQDCVDYVDCWYDIDTKSLFLIYKDINKKSVYFKIYKPDRNVGIPEDDDLDDLGIGNIEVEYETPRGEDQQILYNVELNKQLQKCLDDYYFFSGKSFLFYHKVSKCLLLIFNGLVIQFAVNFNNKQIKTLNIAVIRNVNEVFKYCDEKLNICDYIIGYDEFRSCLILNLKKCTKQINLVYAFKIFVVRVMDITCDWKKVM